MEECGAVVDHEFWMDEKINSLGLDAKKLLAMGRVSLWENVQSAG